MRTFTAIALFLQIFISSCTTTAIGSKFVPEFQGVDLRLQYLVDEFVWLSKQNNVVFRGKVSLGLKTIKDAGIAGLCHRGLGFREIDIDINYWNVNTKATRMAVVFHELAHCYCGRSHDYDNGVMYPPTEYERIHQALTWLSEGGKRPGRYEDGCPTSLMYPVVVGDDCMMSHYGEYTREMFNRCKPY